MRALNRRTGAGYHRQSWCRDAAQQSMQDDLQFHPGQLLPGTLVPTLAKADVRVVLALQVQLVVRVPKTIDLGGHCPTGRTECL
jgi:hypothetical protein